MLEHNITQPGKLGQHNVKQTKLVERRHRRPLSYTSCSVIVSILETNNTSLTYHTIICCSKQSLFDLPSQVVEMINNIRDTFIENLRTLDWMDDTTKKAAEKKVYFSKSFDF